MTALCFYIYFLFQKEENCVRIFPPFFRSGEQLFLLFPFFFLFPPFPSFLSRP